MLTPRPAPTSSVMASVSWTSSTRAVKRAVQMVRDPVCGVFVIPDRAVMITDGRRQLFFCSAKCRDKYRAPPA